MNETDMSVYIVVAAFNEQSVLGTVLDELTAACPEASIVVVDDGSTDGTSDVAVGRPVRLLRHAINRGQGAALRTGIGYSLARGADIVVTFDGDGQMCASDVNRICEPIRSGSAEVVLGTRFGRIRPAGMPAARRVVLKLGTVFTRLTARLKVTDTYNGLRAFSRSAAERLDIRQDRMGHGLEILYEVARLKLRWVEVPVNIRYTEYSVQKGLSSIAALDIVADLWAGRRW